MEKTAAERHPKGLYVLFGTEMWERFSFYLMIGILYQYLSDSQKGGMGWSEAKAASIVGSYVAGVYFTPFIGGLIADRLLGCRITIIMGGLFMAAGHILLAFPTELALYAALASLVVGNGLFKPNISTLVGNLYAHDSPLRDRAFTIFYMGINIGAFFCNFVAALVRNQYGWHWAFATAGFGMLLGLTIFITFQKYIRHADRNPRAGGGEPRESLTPLWAGCLTPAALFGAVGYWLGAHGDPLNLGPTTTMFIFACVPVVGFYLWIWNGLKDRIERGRVAALLTIYAVVIVFWAVQQLNSTALTSFAVSSTDRAPNAVVKPIVDLAPDFAENAPPDYFANAGAEMARPDRGVYEIVSPERYKELEKAKELSVVDGKKVPVTQAMFDSIYAATTSATPTLAPGQHLKLVNSELFQSINPGFIILIAPLMVALWSWLNRRRKEPSTPVKIGLGLVLTAGSALVMVGAVAVAGAGKVSGWWLWGTYGVVTIGELCLSPIGLSMVTKQSPARIRAFMMGGWFLSISVGGKLSGVAGELYTKVDHKLFFIVNAVATGVAGVAIFALLPWLRRQMADDAPGDSPDAGEGADAERATA